MFVSQCFDDVTPQWIQNQIIPIEFRNGVLENAGAGKCRYWKLSVLANVDIGKCRY